MGTHFENRFYRQDITIWKAGVRDQFGKVTWAGPVAFKGRWDDKIQEVMGPKGETFTSRAMIHFPEDIDIDLNDYLYLGVTIETDPQALDDAYEVRSVQKIPDIRNLQMTKVAIL